MPPWLDSQDQNLLPLCLYLLCTSTRSRPSEWLLPLMGDEKCPAGVTSSSNSPGAEVNPRRPEHPAKPVDATKREVARIRARAAAQNKMEEVESVHRP